MLPRDPRTPSLLSIVIPLYNEQGSIDALIPRVRQVLEAEGLNAEIILVNDGSTDQTWDKMVGWRGVHETLTLVDLSRNFGKEIAITAGLDVAEGDAVIIMDGDLQHPPEDIPRMLDRAALGDVDIVVASRYVAGGTAGGLAGATRTAVSRTSTLLTKAMFPRKLHGCTAPLASN